jgi:Zn-dependent protease with chaperone function
MLAIPRRIAGLILTLFGIPALGWWTAGELAGFRRPVRLLGMALGDASVAPYLAKAAVGAAVLGATLVVLIVLAALFCGRNRDRLVLVFGPVVEIVSLALAVLVVLQGAIAAYSLVILELVFLNHFIWQTVPAIGIGASVVAFGIARSCFRLNAPLETTVLGRAVSATEQARLWQLVLSVARRLKARPPNHIILGLSPEFFAIAAPVRLAGSDSVLAGETLYLSLPLLRTISEAELTAIIGHELGHFLGEDTAYTLRFVPIYRGLVQALSATGINLHLGAVAAKPAKAVLELCLLLFSRVERAIGRQRELAADRLGAAIASPEAVVAALLHTAVAPQVWATTIGKTIQGIQSGAPIDNLSTLYADQAGAAIAAVTPAEWLAALRDRQQPHPTDTHPTAAARAAALGVALDVGLLDFAAGLDRAVTLVDSAEALERSLSATCRNLLIESGRARPPRNGNRPTASQKKLATLAGRAAARQRALDKTAGPT